VADRRLGWIWGVAFALIAFAAVTAGGHGSVLQTAQHREAGPTHLHDWKYVCKAGHGCVNSRNMNVELAWMGRHVDWNEVGATREQIGISSELAADGAKHIIVYTDPNIAPYCGPFPILGGKFISSLLMPPGVAEDGSNPCSHAPDEIAGHLHAEHGSYAHAFQHQGNNGNRLYEIAAPDDGGTKYEPFFIGDPDVQAAFAEVTRQNSAATDVFEDDGGGGYNCEPSYGYCGSDAKYGRTTYAPPSCAHTDVAFWCYYYGETAVEWDRHSSPANPLGAQQAYENDAVNLTDASSRPVIANNGGHADEYSLAWARRATRLEGIMLEGAWGTISEPRWTNNADAALLYHAMHKYVIEYFGGDGASPNVLTQLASHWIVYDPVYSVEAIPYNFPSGSGNEDGTFPEETIVPSAPIVATPASSDVTAFRTSPNVFVREYAVCYQDGTPIGGCAAIVNIGGGAAPIRNLMRPYRHVLVQNTERSWFRGGRPRWSTAVPNTIAAATGLILAQ
jgi:hypothetical protein